MTREDILKALENVKPNSESELELASMLVFEELGWDIIYAEHEIDCDPTILGRNHHGEVILERYLFNAIKFLNPDLPDEAFQSAKDELVRDRSTMSLAKANQQIYTLLKDGVKVSFRDKDGVRQDEKVQLINWSAPNENHFLLVSQMWVAGDMYKRRPDLIGFINGIPLLFMELKNPDKNIKHAYEENLRDYKDTIPHLLWYNGIVLLSNGTEAKAGSVTAEWEHFADWKKIHDEGETGVIDLDTLIRATCPKERLTDIVENFTLFMNVPGGLVKMVSKNHQFLGVNNAIEAVSKAKESEGRLGVFWHTQGSGKSASMIFFSQKVLRKIPGNWTFVIITDRTELDGQIYETFQNSGAVSEEKVQADSAKHLRQLLTEDHRYIFTLIHKFRTDNGETHPVLSDRDDIIIITDEAHRSQYDVMAQNMRDALPNASFLGFTGTPLIHGEEQKTREVFGEYVSMYNFKQSIDDKATVPLYYENRLPEVHLNAYGEEFLNDEMTTIIDEAMLDESQEKKLERYFSRMYHIITRDDRLDKVANDIVEHFMGRGHLGKAMVVAIDKATAVKLFDKVQIQWEAKINTLKTKIPNTVGNELEVLAESISYMEETDMAVMVSSGQNEIDDLRKKGVDIKPHRKRIVEEELDVKFKDPDDPFRIVFVCAMWMTGFDVPSCSTIYLDKPLRNHTLMQTIARANRVFPDKPNGLIVDYVGIFRNLEKALSVYADPGKDQGDMPIKNKDEIKSLLQTAIDETVEFSNSKNVDLIAIRDTKDVFERTAMKEDAVENLIEHKKEFRRLADQVTLLYKAYLPDPIEQEVGQLAYLIRKIVKQMIDITEPIDITYVTKKVDQLLDECVEGYAIHESEDGSHIYDLSQVDFDALKKKYEKGRKRIEIDRFKSMIEKKLDSLIAKNKSRMDFHKRYKEMIEEYLSGSANLDELFENLVNFSQELNHEEQRHIREELENEEELAVFDLLTKPNMNLNKKETKQVKAIARKLLKTLQTEKMVLDWKKKQQTRAGVKVAIEEVLDGLPEAYSKDVFDGKCSAVYDYVWELAL